MKIKVGIDNIGYTLKPQKGYEMNEIKTRARKNIREYDLMEAADLIGNKGHAILPGLLLGGNKAELCKGMQIFALDFDDGISSEKVLERCQRLDLEVAFAYHTFSSSAEDERFRIVFVHSTVIEEVFVVKAIIHMLQKLFPEADKACKNLDRLYLGGKDCFYINESARLALVQLTHALYKTLDGDDNHYQRNLKTFAYSTGIVLYNNSLAIGKKEDLDTIFGGILDSSIIHIIEESGKPPFFIAERKNGLVEVHQSKTCYGAPRKINLEDADCLLMRDFESGVDLSHEEKFGLMTNYIHISGGQKRFLEVVDRYYGSEKCVDWKKQIFYAKGYYPQHCDRMCPYCEQCVHQGTIVDTLALDRKVKKLFEEEYVSIERVSEIINNNLSEAIETPGPAIYLIKAQTGAGKTYEYIDTIKWYKDQKFIIALPTNKLKEQVAEDIEKHFGNCFSEPVFVTLSVVCDPFIPQDIKDKIAEAHEAGFHNKTKSILKAYLKEIEETMPDHIALIEDIKRQIQGLDAYQGERIVITTHARLIQLPESFVSQFCVIIDEDILQLQVFTNTKKISVDSLEKIKDSGLAEYSDIAKRMLAVNPGYYQRLDPHHELYSLKESQLEELGIYGENVNDITKAASCVMIEDDEGNKVKYFCPVQFPRTKMIIMSATIDYDIYQWYFNDGWSIVTYPEAKARINGKIKQFTYHSLGKRDLLNKKEALSFLYSISGNPQLPVISFKGIEGKLELSHTLNDYGLNFGNTMGINSLKGKDIGILGTFFKREEAYKLVACFLGGKINKPVDKNPRPRRVEYNGYSFILTSYEDTVLRTIQLNSIYSELEQCVGRARVLREDCTVYVLSAFPCDQADIHISNYLVTDRGGREERGQDGAK